MPLGADTGSGGANPTFDSSGHSERGVSKTRNGGPNPLGERLGPERNGRREATVAAVRGRFGSPGKPERGPLSVPSGWTSEWVAALDVMGQR
jgi:hypothetical protein